VLARATDGALVVTKAGSTHVDQLATACEALRITGATVLGVVLNCVPRKLGSSYYGGYAHSGYRSNESAGRSTTSGSKRRHPDALRPAAQVPGTPNPPSFAHAQPAADLVTSQATAMWSVQDTGPASARIEPVAHHLVNGALFPEPIATGLPERDPEHRVVLPRPDALPETVRAAISSNTPTPHQLPLRAAHPVVDNHPTRTRGRQRGRRAARNLHEPELIIDADRGTATQAAAADGSSWHVEWGDLPALIAGPRDGDGHDGVDGRVNGSNGRHRN